MSLIFEMPAKTNKNSKNIISMQGKNKKVGNIIQNSKNIKKSPEK